MDNEQVEIVTIPPHTLIRINGIPFELSESAQAYGLQSNLDLAFELREPTSLAGTVVKSSGTDEDMYGFD